MEGRGEDFERLYREEAARIRGPLASRLGDVGLAEDVVQDAVRPPLVVLNRPALLR
jgi:DNA-directed RNA polymerase specialized sigma24 family protein